jgi:hypothetical protein
LDPDDHNAFFIGFVPEENPAEKDAVGVIRIGDFQERFRSPLSFWSPQDYERQWREGAERILAGATTSCLITSMLDPRSANFIVWWPMFLNGTRVITQNQILFLNKLAGPFDPRDPYKYVEPRGADSEPVSEWHTTTDAIRSFLAEPKGAAGL